MSKMKRLIFKVNDLEKEYKSTSALSLKKLEIHPGTIYGIIGNVGRFQQGMSLNSHEQIIKKNIVKPSF